jgi:predicted RNA-binding Zn-ribbon protein involved in translation (DUF1610 family)
MARLVVSLIPCFFVSLTLRKMIKSSSMRRLRVNRIGAAKLKASVGRDHGMQLVDLFVDHTPGAQDIHIASGANGPVTMSEHLKLILAPFACPSCNSQHVTSSYGWSVRQWFLRFAGRKIFVCSDCGSTQVVKVRRCEWEIIATTIAITLLLLAASIHWVFR